MADIRTDYKAWKAKRQRLSAAEEEGDFPRADDWHGSDDQAVMLLEAAMAELERLSDMRRSDIAEVARVIREGREHYSSNRAHLRHAEEVARYYDKTYKHFDPAHFVRSCMPSEWVGTAKANLWERAIHFIEVERWSDG